MAGRIRTIKPEVLSDAKAARLPDDAWRLWVSMWVMADDLGRLPAEPAYLGGQVFWGKPNPLECASRALASLREASMLLIYEVRGESYAQIRGWSKHQKIDKPSGPKFPGPNGELEGLSTPRLANPREGSRTFDPDHDRDQDQEHPEIEAINLNSRSPLEHTPRVREGGAVDNFDVDSSISTETNAQEGVSHPNPGKDGEEGSNVAPRARGELVEGVFGPPRTRKAMPPDDALTAATLLLGYVVQNAPDSRLAKKTERDRQGVIERWAVTLERFHQRGMSWGAIDGSIDFTQRSQFWKGRVIGPDKLIEHWDTIQAQRLARKGEKGAAAPARKSPSALAAEELAAIAAREKESA